MSDDKTRVIRRPLDINQGPQPDQPFDPDATRVVEHNEGTRTVDERYQAAANASTLPARPGPPPLQKDDSTTKVLWRPQREAAPFDPLQPTKVAQDDSKDPVVGWLVIVRGNGRGSAVRLGYGMNTIGRDPSQRVSLNFGDEGISRLNHARLVYDPRARKFSIAPGDGVNLTYVSLKPGHSDALLAPTELMAGCSLLMGDTELKFVPLCGPEFDWQDNA